MNINIKLKNKKVLTYFLALTLVASPIMTYAEANIEVRPISAEIDAAVPISAEVTPVSEEETPNYIEFHGKITNVNSGEGRFSILAENDLENALDKLVSHLSDDVVILDEETMDSISMENLVEGMEVSIYYEKDTMMMLSYPPQLSPDVVIVRSDDVDLNIKIDKFGKELVSDDNSLKLNLNDEVELEDLKGNKIEKEDLANKDLIVFYGASTRSIPAQTTPKKVIAIKNHEVKTLHYFNLNGTRINLGNIMYKTDDGELMIPLREITEVLDFNVGWDQETKSVKIEKDDYTASLTIGKSEYQYYDMIIDLEVAPELIESTTYVPVSFIQNILVAGTQVTMDGVLEITKY
ncbi:MAG: hypothetical protein GX053_06930 [Tissierella sp.]|nr:hypothetical protein [Tissierella sp.]